ncbi:MAG TPA: hypothetical protein DHV28_02955 [Ignavibacteriales bacterium]|nr:hypothetical protein [Ignavibacteriales bacterium]
MKNLSLILIVLVLCSFNITFSQTEDQLSEINSTVPELFDFHEVVYPLWHTAYPNKDYTLFKQLLPEVNAGVEKIYAAKLPGILRDKEKEWNAGLDKLRASVKDYNKACEENNEAGMLTTAEELHSNFEMLVRIVKPVTKEVDEFHKVLYMIYHHYGPNKNTEDLSKAIDDLYLRSDELKNCVLPKWATDKKDEFTKAADELYASTKELKELKDSKADEKLLNAGIDKVHTNYQKLEALFD